MNGRPRFDRRRPEPGLRINHRIRVPEVRVIYEGEQLGIMSPGKAIEIAQHKGLDLVEISPRAIPPVCRIMDYGKFKFEEAKKKRAQKKGQSTVGTKEIKFRPKTDEHDLDFKTKHIRRFLEDGNKVRLVVVFRGREMAHPQMGKVVLDRVVERIGDIATLEVSPNMEGRAMFAIIAPRPGVVQKAQAAKKAQADAERAAQLAKKDAKARQQQQEDDELDEDEINAGIEDDDGDDLDDADDPN